MKIKMFSKHKSNIMIFIALFFVYFLFKYAFNIIFPFVFGFFISQIMLYCSKILVKFTGLNSKIIRMICLILCYVLFFLFAFYFVRLIVSQMFEILQYASKFYERNIIPFISNFTNKIKTTQIGGILEKYFSTSFVNGENHFFSLLSDVPLKLAGITTKFALLLPEIFITFIVMIVSSFLICFDYERILKFFCSYIPDTFSIKVSKIKKPTLNFALKILRCYFIIFVITFGELFLGLWLLKVKYAILLALIIAVVDIMPLVGTGLILIPWAIISLISGEIPFAVGVFALYLIITIIRNIIEPKLIGKNIGIHPLITLALMYIGLKLGGVFLAVYLLVSLFIIKIFNSDDIRFSNNKTTNRYIK